MREPRWWYRPEVGGAARLLRPISQLWARRAERAFTAAVPYRARLPVVCIGNFTAGGTGKTPLAARIGVELAARGRTPVILSRGHGGSIRGPHWVDPTADTASRVGDEPLLHAAHLPVVVARDRALGARLIEARGSPTDVIVMDDGLQNPSLAKDLTIAVVDSRRGVGNGLVMPAGPLRAPLAFQLSLVDAIVANLPEGANAVESAIVRHLRRHFEGPVLTAVTRPAARLDWLAGLPVVAWAGIGHPDRFFDLLARHGARIIHRTMFPDHHLPSDREAERLLAAADRHGARLVTTEKDLVRLGGGPATLAALREASRAVPIVLEFDAGDAERLSTLLAAAVLAPRATKV